MNNTQKKEENKTVPLKVMWNEDVNHPKTLLQ
jgi:hypothetical protein